MSEITVLNHDVATMSRTHLGARLATLAAAGIFVASLGGAADLDVMPALAMLGLALLATWHPHTLMPLIAMLYLIVNWLALVPPMWSLWSPWTLLAALALLVFHTGTAMCASVPAQAPIPQPLWGLTGRRLGIVSGLTVIVWAAAGAIQLADIGSGVVPALVGLCVLAVATAVHYRSTARPQADSLR